MRVFLFAYCTILLNEFLKLAIDLWSSFFFMSSMELFLVLFAVVDLITASFLVSFEAGTNVCACAVLDARVEAVPLP